MLIVNAAQVLKGGLVAAIHLQRVDAAQAGKGGV